MTGIDWDRVGSLTIDQVVTDAKLSGSLLGWNGRTTPEGWPFVVVVAVAKPGNEGIIPVALQFYKDVEAITTSGGLLVRKGDE